jgi:2-polyprenyl-6-methoxyphenol hydroxylase-like FAD-dependent oxidoreductase
VTHTSYDAIVIGSRCAGAPTAMLLARRGRRVLLVDRATQPSDVVSGHAIQPAGVARLAGWGLLDRVRATGTPFTSRVRFDFGPIVLDGTPDPVEGQDAVVCIRRTILDALLTDAAAEAGAEVRLGFTVKELLHEDGRVVGIRGRDASGAVVEERATIVVGADGAHSFVARSVGARAYAEHPATTLAAYSYWRGLDLDACELYARPGRFVIALATNGGLAIVVQVAPVAEAGRFRADLERAVADTFAMVPHLGERVAAAQRVERFRLSTDTAAFLRVPHGPGWALVGDAAHHVDPITAQGMLDAAVGPMHEFTAGLAHVDQPPSPELQALIGAVADDAALTSRFLGIIAGSTPVDEFLHPANVSRIVAGAAVAA